MVDTNNSLNVTVWRQDMSKCSRDETLVARVSEMRMEEERLAEVSLGWLARRIAPNCRCFPFQKSAVMGMKKRSSKHQNDHETVSEAFGHTIIGLMDMPVMCEYCDQGRAMRALTLPRPEPPSSPAAASSLPPLVAPSTASHRCHTMSPSDDTAYPAY